MNFLFNILKSPLCISFIRRFVNKHSVDGSILILYGLAQEGIIPQNAIPSIDGIGLTQIFLGLVILLGFKYLWKKI